MAVVLKESGIGNCLETHCKDKSVRMDFCKVHFGHFKAGAIKKTGVRVSDYDKKMAHYNKHKAQYE